MPLNVSSYALRKYLYRFFTPISESTSGFAGGVNIRDAPNQLATNVLLDERGGASKRLGCLTKGTFGVSGDRILSCTTFAKQVSPGVAPQVVIHTSGGKVYYTTDPNASPPVWTQIVTGVSTTAPMSFAMYNNVLYFGNGIDIFASWDGTTYTQYPSAPKGAFLIAWKDAMWQAGVPGLPDRVYTSNAGDPTTYAVSGWVDIQKGNGSATSGLGTDSIYLVVFKRRGHSVITDPVNFTNRLVDAVTGCESHFSIIQHLGTLYFLSRKGVAKFYGDAPAAILSDKIAPIFTPDILNLNTMTTAYAYTIEDRVGWAVPEAGSLVPTMQIEFAPKLADQGTENVGPFYFHRMPAKCFTTYRSGATERLFAAHNGANKFLQAFAAIGQDDGVTFGGIVETRAFEFNTLTQSKYIRRIDVLGRGKFNILVKKDFEVPIVKTATVDFSGATDTWSLGDAWGVGTWGPNSVIKTKMVNTDIYGRIFTLQIVDAESGVGSVPLPVGSQDYAVTAGEWGIYGIELNGQLLGVRV
jgi:hypothetical protein